MADQLPDCLRCIELNLTAIYYEFILREFLFLGANNNSAQLFIFSLIVQELWRYPHYSTIVDSFDDQCGSCSRQTKQAVVLRMAIAILSLALCRYAAVNGEARRLVHLSSGGQRLRSRIVGCAGELALLVPAARLFRMMWLSALAVANWHHVNGPNRVVAVNGAQHQLTGHE